MGENTETRMAETRALLTEREREQLAGEHGNERRYQATARIRQRTERELPADLETIEQNHSELLGELLAVVVRNGLLPGIDTFAENHPAEYELLRSAIQERED